MKLYLWVDQYGSDEYASSATELRKRLGGRMSKMYVDKTDGRRAHVGYVIGNRWFRQFAPVERAA